MLFTFTKRNIGILALIATALLIIPGLVLGAPEPNGAPRAGWLEEILWTFVVGVFGTLVYLAGQLLNVAVETYTVGFANQFISLGLGFAVENLWETVRDIFNLTFIFGLVYIGFKMILNTGDTNARRMLVHIILAALLVNFSLFFTKFIIDFSNIAAAQIAQGFHVAGNAVGEQYRVSDKFAQIVGISNIYKDDLQSAQSLAEGKASGFTYIFFTMIMFIIMAFVFFAGAILLMIRFVVLNLYMILSPIMFLGWVFPALSSYSERYWSSFLSRAFFAPAYLLMLYFAFVVMQQYAGLINSEGSFRELFTGEAEAGLLGTFATTVPFFAMMCIFLIAAVVVAQKMGGDLAGFVISTTKKTTGKVAFGVPAWALQRTAGAGANRLANKISNNEKWNRTRLGKGGIAISRKVADSSFDTRRAFDLGKKLDIGEGKAGGYTTMIKEKEKEDKAFAESLEKRTRDADGNYLPDVKDKINNSKSVVDAKTKAEELEKEIATSDKEVKEKEKEIKTLQTKLAQETNDRLKEAIQGEIEFQNNDLKKAETTLEKATKGHKEAIKVYESEMVAEEARIKYGSVIAFRDSRNSDAEFLGNRATKIGAGVASGVATAGALTAIGMTGGAVLIPAAAMALLGHELVRSVGEINQKGAQAITSVYGANGTAKSKKDKKKQELKILSEAQKEAEDSSDSASAPEAPKA
ncbi:MAG: hypothetical protein KBC78_01220 [Candidatus Pacebacteria bacterium]|nr:hypothetical protein [Candidatus Paceibacterota bacterium]